MIPAPGRVLDPPTLAQREKIAKGLLARGESLVDITRVTQLGTQHLVALREELQRHPLGAVDPLAAPRGRLLAAYEVYLAAGAGLLAAADAYSHVATGGSTRHPADVGPVVRKALKSAGMLAARQPR
jgi:hypothetical protein